MIIAEQEFTYSRLLCKTYLQEVLLNAALLKVTSIVSDLAWLRISLNLQLSKILHCS